MRLNARTKTFAKGYAIGILVFLLFCYFVFRPKTHDDALVASLPAGVIGEIVSYEDGTSMAGIKMLSGAYTVCRLDNIGRKGDFVESSRHHKGFCHDNGDSPIIQGPRLKGR